jgi:hypothetical protein
MNWKFVTPEILLNINYLFRFKKITDEYDYDYGFARLNGDGILVLKMKGEMKVGWDYQINPNQIEYSLIPE